MSNSGPFGDPQTELRAAIRGIQDAVRELHESVVRSVMDRNRAEAAATKIEREIADLDTKAALAEEASHSDVAAELRAERDRRTAELVDARGLASRLAAAAEAAKTGQPAEEARLLQQARELRARFAASAGSTIGGEAGLSEADVLFERARSKTAGLQNEASARAEVAASRGPAPHAAVEQTADQLLAALEARIAGGHMLASTPGPPGASSALPEPGPHSTGEAALDAASQHTWAAAIGRAAAGERAPMDPTQRVRIAAVGTGNIFRSAHLPAYPDIAQAQLVAFCDPDPAAQKAVQKRYHELMEARRKQAEERGDQETVERIERDREAIQVVGDISEVIATIKPDLVDICTQPMLHAPLSIQALEAGINVMCEKPISRSWLESQRLIETVKRTGKLYQHNENWLWDRDWYTAKKLVDSGAIGEPLLMFLATAHGGPEGAGRFWNSDYGGGGALLDNGIHAIGASWYVSGLDKRPTYVKAAEPFGMSIRMPNRILDGRFQQVRVDDDAHILIRFENPETLAWTTAHVEGSWSHRDSPDTVVIGSTGKILFVSEESRRYAVVIDSYDREARRIEVSGPTWQHWPSSFYGEILNMVECVRNDTPSISDATFGAECSAVVGASYLSERDGRRGVSVEEFKQFARGIAEQYPGDPAAADNALVDALLSAVRT
ncbi:MAG TPA: Gfo/Idh/MocA family oxidoreductase [Chthonomonadaceae bacterium]|nr:Gfo/Idh/MocA family oxidoreductase [Chthonomonadaceae bacterium]